MALSPAIATALQGSSVAAFYAFRCQLPTGNIALLDGSGTVTFGGLTYTGSDPVFGKLLAIGTIEESLATEAPVLSVTIAPATANTAVSLSNGTQGSPAQLYFGLVNPVLGTVIGTPELLFSGSLEFARTTVTADMHTCELEVSSFEKLFIPSEGERLNDAWHQSIFPGETGLSQSVSSVVVDPVWGSAAVQPTSTPGSFDGGF